MLIERKNKFYTDIKLYIFIPILLGLVLIAIYEQAYLRDFIKQLYSDSFSKIVIWKDSFNLSSSSSTEEQNIPLILELPNNYRQDSEIAEIAIKTEEKLLNANTNFTKDESNYNIDNFELIRLTNYRNFLANAQYMLIKFFQNEKYKSELELINSIIMPDDVLTVINDLSEYNESYLLTKDNAEYTTIFPIEYKIIEDLIKVTKKSDSLKRKELLKIKIISNLHLLIDFIYSPKLQKLFLDDRKNYD